MQQENVIVGLIQMAVGPDPHGNLKKAVANVEQAAKDGAQIICLPELYRTHYFPQGIGVNTSSLAETIPGESTRAFSEIARRHNVVIIVPLYEKSAGGRFYNSAVIIDADGTLHTPYHKVHIPQDPGFFEKGYFYPGGGYRSTPPGTGVSRCSSAMTSGSPKLRAVLPLTGQKLFFTRLRLAIPPARTC